MPASAATPAFALVGARLLGGHADQPLEPMTLHALGREDVPGVDEERGAERLGRFLEAQVDRDGASLSHRTAPPPA